MKRVILKIISRIIVRISPILWNIPYKWAFLLHQYLGRLVVYWHHAYNLGILIEE